MCLQCPWVGSLGCRVVWASMPSIWKSAFSLCSVLQSVTVPGKPVPGLKNGGRKTKTCLGKQWKSTVVATLHPSHTGRGRQVTLENGRAAEVTCLLDGSANNALATKPGNLSSTPDHKLNAVRIGGRKANKKLYLIMSTLTVTPAPGKLTALSSLGSCTHKHTVNLIKVYAFRGGEKTRVRVVPKLQNLSPHLSCLGWGA